MPTAVGTDYVISTSDMTDASARSNVLSPLRDLGLLDKDNKPTDLAERWRHDDEYVAVCKEIRAATYPSALIEAFPEGSVEQKEGIKKWFMKNSKVGEAAGRMFADTYMLLSQADLTAVEGEAKSVRSPRTKRLRRLLLRKWLPKLNRPQSLRQISQPKKTGLRRNIIVLANCHLFILTCRYTSAPTQHQSRLIEYSPACLSI